MFFGLLQIMQGFFLFSYVTGSNSFPKPLTVEEEQKYLQDYQNGCVVAKNILIERNLRLVAHVVKKYSNYNKENEDLISIGTIGLIKAITSYKPDKGTRLATYAARCIDNAILTLWRFQRLRLKTVPLLKNLQWTSYGITALYSSCRIKIYPIGCSDKK